MRIEKIDENKLKITLPISYFAERNISIEQFTQDAPAVQEFFCDLMEAVEEQYGFSFTNSLIKIEASISSANSTNEIVLILTRTPNGNDGVSLVDRYLSRKAKKTTNKNNNKNANNNKNTSTNLWLEFAKIIGGKDGLWFDPVQSKKDHLKYINCEDSPTDTLIFRFDDFDILCGLAKTINHFYKDFNSLYALNSRYYMVFKRTKLRNVALMFHEFGELVYNPAFTEGYLNEYGKLIFFGNAIESIAKL